MEMLFEMLRDRDFLSSGIAKPSASCKNKLMKCIAASFLTVNCNLVFCLFSVISRLRSRSVLLLPDEIQRASVLRQLHSHSDFLGDGPGHGRAAGANQVPSPGKEDHWDLAQQIC